MVGYRFLFWCLGLLALCEWKLMKVSDLTGWLGFVFCEFTFRWFDAFDVPFDDKDYRWHHRVSYLVGSTSYSIGCWFYNIGEADESR